MIEGLGGSSFESLVALPHGDMGPAMLLARGLFSNETEVTRILTHLANMGYLVLCPDLYRGKNKIEIPYKDGALDWQQLEQFYRNFDGQAAARDLLAAAAYARRRPECGGKIGVLGYGLGSSLAFLMAARSDVDCVVGYDGAGLDARLDEAPDIRMPYLIHMAQNDQLLSDAARVRVVRALSRHEKISLYIYEGVEHGFAETSGPTYNAEVALLARGRTESFLRQNLMA
ncbi:MAG: dienelactone hydrolase family protein [Alphaproteobacteria bacterium]|nr:dienelactone hydrolase family protein [Alphaproteobacteria bacterium]